MPEKPRISRFLVDSCKREQVLKDCIFLGARHLSVTHRKVSHLALALEEQVVQLLHQLVPAGDLGDVEGDCAGRQLSERQALSLAPSNLPSPSLQAKCTA
jgi:hypothetical protein